MDSNSTYVLQDASKTRCPDCQEYVKLLCREDGSRRWPWFYICFNCSFITEVGKGRIPRE